MNKVSLVIPCHPPKFDFLKNLILSTQEHKIDTDIFVVFSSEDDSKLFGIYGLPNYNSLVYKGPVNPGIITNKKFYGLYEAFKSSEYVAAIDSECVFTKHVDIYEKFKKFHDKKTIYGSHSHNELIARIRTGPIKLFDENAKRCLVNFMNSYFWFNQIPIYEKNTFLDFYSKLGVGTDHFMNSINQFDFDFIIYCYYLFVYQEWNFITFNITKNYSIMEDSKTVDNLQDIFNQMEPYWTRKGLELDSSFMKFHLDRD